MCSLSMRNIQELKYLFATKEFSIDVLAEIFSSNVLEVAASLSDSNYSGLERMTEVPAHVQILHEKQKKQNEEKGDVRPILTEKQKRDIKVLYASRYSQQQIASFYRIHRHTVRRLVVGETHKQTAEVKIGFNESPPYTAKRQALATLFKVPLEDVTPGSIDSFFVNGVGEVWIFLKGEENVRGKKVLHMDLITPGFIVYM